MVVKLTPLCLLSRYGWAAPLRDSQCTTKCDKYHKRPLAPVKSVWEGQRAGKLSGKLQSRETPRKHCARNVPSLVIIQFE